MLASTKSNTLNSVTNTVLAGSTSNPPVPRRLERAAEEGQTFAPPPQLMAAAPQNCGLVFLSPVAPMVDFAGSSMPPSEHMAMTSSPLRNIVQQQQQQIFAGMSPYMPDPNFHLLLLQQQQLLVQQQQQQQKQQEPVDYTHYLGRSSTTSQPYTARAEWYSGTTIATPASPHNTSFDPHNESQLSSNWGEEEDDDHNSSSSSSSSSSLHDVSYSDSSFASIFNTSNVSTLSLPERLSAVTTDDVDSTGQATPTATATKAAASAATISYARITASAAAAAATNIPAPAAPINMSRQYSLSSTDSSSSSASSPTSSSFSSPRQQLFHVPQPLPSDASESTLPSPDAIQTPTSMPKTKLSFKQIKHALPEWIVLDVLQLPKKSPQQSTRHSSSSPHDTPLTDHLGRPINTSSSTKRNRRRRRSRASSSNSVVLAANTSSSSIDSLPSSPETPNIDFNSVAPPSLAAVASTRKLLREISALSPNLQRCFSDWRRERREAIFNEDHDRCQEIERIMWSALHGIQDAAKQEA